MLYWHQYPKREKEGETIMVRTAKSKIGKKEKNDRLYKAILMLETEEECYNFFQDLCTVSELRSMEQRYEVATLLNDGMIYNDILERTGASSATISRVNRSLIYGNGGYESVLEKMKEKEKERKQLEDDENDEKELKEYLQKKREEEETKKESSYMNLFAQKPADVKVLPSTAPKSGMRLVVKKKKTEPKKVMKGLVAY